MTTPSDPYRTPDEPEQNSPTPQAPWSGNLSGDQPAGYGNVPPAAPPVGAYGMPPQQQKSSGLAIASLVLGIVGIVTFWLYAIPSILAVIFGHVALSKVKNGTGDGRGMAIAGLTMGWIVVGIVILLVAIGASVLAGA